jgi:hypothetical protein
LKKLFKLCAAVLAAVTVVSLAGCSARSPVTADEFTKQAKAAGFTVKEESATNADVVKYLSAVKSETGTEIIFISFKTDDAAESMYTSVKSSITKDTNGTAKTLDSATYSKYTLVNGELSHTLTRMGTTLVYGKATTTHQNQVDDLMKAIKY